MTDDKKVAFEPLLLLILVVVVGLKSKDIYINRYIQDGLR